MHALPPGGGASRDAPAEAHGAAAALALRLGGALAALPAPLPVYYYGAASRQGRALADVRRALGYFGANGGVSAAAGGGFKPPPGAPPPDAGPEQASEAAGVRCFVSAGCALGCIACSSLSRGPVSDAVALPFRVIIFMALRWFAWARCLGW